MVHCLTWQAFAKVEAISASRSNAGPPVVEKLARMTPEEANRPLSFTPTAGCRNSFSSCNDGKATSDDLHRKDWDGSSPQAGPAASPPRITNRRCR